MESLRQQLAEAQGSIVRGQRESSSELTQLQTDMGRLKQEMTEKVRAVFQGTERLGMRLSIQEDMVRGLEEQLSVVEEDRNSLKEMLSTLETMVSLGDFLAPHVTCCHMHVACRLLHSAGPVSPD